MKALLTLIALACVGILAGCQSDQPTSARSSDALGKTVVLPVSEWLDAQGTYCFDNGSGCDLWVPPVGNQLGWVEVATMRGALVDYAGLADDWIRTASNGARSFGTTFSGTVKKRELADGRAHIEVDLHTYNALAFGFAGTFDADGNPAFDFGGGTLTFGARAYDVFYNGMNPALADCHFKLEMIVPSMEYRMLDLMEALWATPEGVSVESIQFESTANGELHAAFGVPEGTAGKQVISQVGHLNSPCKSKKFDGFPVESINQFPTGR